MLCRMCHSKPLQPAIVTGALLAGEAVGFAVPATAESVQYCVYVYDQATGTHIRITLQPGAVCSNPPPG